MTKIHPQAYFGNVIVPFDSANVSIASSAVLYGLSVYTVFPIIVVGDEVGDNNGDGVGVGVGDGEGDGEGGGKGSNAVDLEDTHRELFAFRLHDHYIRLVNSAKIIGIDMFEKEWNFEKFTTAVKELIQANTINKLSFVRATIHVTDLVPGTRSRGLATTLSMFIYEANPIIPQNGARLKTGVWRRVPDSSIPSRAKVNGAYINSVLGKQDAIDSGYDDCLFLDIQGQVCELSAANIFMVRDGVLITPNQTSDILEGINRKTVIEIAHQLQIPVIEREVDLTEIYIADELFACGTSAFIAPIAEVDKRKIGNGENYGNGRNDINEEKSSDIATFGATVNTANNVNATITQKIKEVYVEIFSGKNKEYNERYLTRIMSA